jgi:hypothetical protein
MIRTVVRRSPLPAHRIGLYVGIDSVQSTVKKQS